MAVLPAENVGGRQVTADKMETFAGLWPVLCARFLVLKLGEDRYSV